MDRPTKIGSLETLICNFMNKINNTMWDFISFNKYDDSGIRKPKSSVVSPFLPFPYSQ
jgi:hypothetical protein